MLFRSISASSKVHDEAELRRQVDFVCRTYRQPALVEEFVAGREFTIGIIGNGLELRTLPIMEIDFSKVSAEANGIYTYQFKKEWTARENFLCPAPVDEEIAERMRYIALRAFHSIGCRDYARVDFRLSSDGIPYVIWYFNRNLRLSEAFICADRANHLPHFRKRSKTAPCERCHQFHPVLS